MEVIHHPKSAESQDCMLFIALNVALGFLGHPFDGARPAPHADQGVDLVIEDAYTMQQLCACETVALGYPKFCDLFTPTDSAFSSPVARGFAIGAHNSSTNATLTDDPRTFPLRQSLYVDAMPEVIALYGTVLTALKLTSSAKDRPLSATHIPHNRAFRTVDLVPFATNVQFQLLSCNSTPDTQIRVSVNDGVVPLTGFRGCLESADGACPLLVFVAAMREIIGETDWAWARLGN
ncbi:phosphoglycerate mutase-like protein [Trametes versicolor FP-101664 SS1]|uniref:phosphoglycerate mutase-like protein n=1 Tax=Trametes versicolor (strain FP-101664) TaxID=717944 RepID=UPI00046227E5|nr:phosphoglycerate mutase-like protein [Trametes versicolor FP-101664 SS1]EIW52767.1 phosphoglycerate mutase-like protein [Trametes versicolor FP-101664 SS1]